MTYAESITFLYGLQKFGMKFGLQGIRTLLASLDHPERKFFSIHVAGTNGKGSTASMIAAIFTASGYKTGLYTSPHLIKFNERIRINGKKISSRAVAWLSTKIYPEVKRNNCTFFEAATAIAFKYFADARVDIAIVETGLGGRLDATNVLQPLVSIITTIGLEHTQILGNRVEEIAFEKGGIIKKGVPCVTGVQSRAVIRVIRKICDDRGSQLIRVQSNKIIFHRSSLDGLSAELFMPKKKIRNVWISLAGNHQAMNAALALHAIEIASQRNRYFISEKAIHEGLAHVQQYSGIEARLSIIQRNPFALADVAHNPEAVRVLCASLRRFHLGKIHIVVGLMQDKNYRSIISTLRHIAKGFFMVEARTERSRCAADMAQVARHFGIHVREFHHVADGVSSALQQHDGIPILITGSHFVVGEAMAHLKGEKYLTINQ